jgi:hypothetical protein
MVEGRQRNIKIIQKPLLAQAFIPNLKEYDAFPRCFHRINRVYLGWFLRILELATLSLHKSLPFWSCKLHVIIWVHPPQSDRHHLYFFNGDHCIGFNLELHLFTNLI